MLIHPTDKSKLAGTRRHTIQTVSAVAVLLLICGGCVLPRSDYFSELDYRRVQAYERWKADNGQNERPHLGGPLNIEEAIRLALAYNPSLKALLQEKERARGRVVGAYAEALPTVDVTGNYTRLDEISTIDLGVETFQIGDLDNYSFQVNIEQPLYKGGVILIAQRAARLFQYLSDERVRAGVEQVVAETATVYYQALLANRLIDVRTAAFEAAEAHLREVRTRRENGVATEYDVLRARVDVSNLEADLIAQKNEHDLALASLLKLLGASQQSDVDLVSKLDFREIDVAFSDAVLVAFRNRPDIFVATLEADLQEEALNRAQTEYFPRLSAYYWNKWAKPDPHVPSEIEWGDQWQAGLNLSWTLFDGLAREGNLIEQFALLEKARIELSETEEQTLLDLRNALSEIDNSTRLVESQELNLERADRALELVRAGYREGVNTDLEVLDATAALTTARGNYYRALYRHTAARIALRKAMGILGPPPGSRQVPQTADLEEPLPAVMPRTHKSTVDDSGQSNEEVSY